MWTGRFDALFIDGTWVKPESTDVIEVVSPFTETPIATVPAGSRADMDRAVASARAAFDAGPWPRLTVHERAEVLERVVSGFERRSGELAELITSEMGCPISLSEWMQAKNPRVILSAYLDVAKAFPFRSVRHSATGHALVMSEAVGVVGIIVPWNGPQAVTMMKLAPALLAGCTVVLKPAPETPLDAYLLADVLVEAGLPPGVVNIVPGDAAAGEYLVCHPEVDKISFTGSTAVGRRIAALCGNDIRRVTLELGGKSAAIVLPDADLDATVESLRLGSFRNTGQVCSNKTRLVVPRSLEAEFVERLVGLVESMPVGDPFERTTELGPLVSRRQRERVEGYLQLGPSEGATLVYGGGRPRDLDRGWFVEPTIFSDVTPDMRVAQEEIFGPVVCVMRYDDEEQALQIANSTDYGLSGSVFTRDLDRGLALASRLRSGTVELNGSPAGFSAPMGGFKRSGIGREAGVEGLQAYLEPRAIGISSSLADTLASEDTGTSEAGRAA